MAGLSSPSRSFGPSSGSLRTSTSRRLPSRRWAALRAFDGIDELEAIKASYARNRAILLEELPRAGLSSILPADGAFYLYADISRFTGDSEAFAKTMLKDIGVAVTPGIDFDPDRGRNYIRFCYAGAEAQMREAARCITGWIKGK